MWNSLDLLKLGDPIYIRLNVISTNINLYQKDFNTTVVKYVEKTLEYNFDENLWWNRGLFVVNLLDQEVNDNKSRFEEIYETIPVVSVYRIYFLFLFCKSSHI
mgnify:CR=1 FL=1